MKHLIFFLSLIFILSTLVNAQSNDTQRQGLFGQVRSVREDTARLEIEFGNLKEGPRLPVQHLSFDKKGNVTEQRMNNPDGSLKSNLAWVQIYDNDGQVTEKEYYNAERKLTSKGVFTYDDNGRKSRLTYYNPDGSVNHYQIFTYDDKGNVVEENHQNPNSSPLMQISYKYDENGRQTEMVFYKPDGIVSHKGVYTYDQNGNKSGWTMYDGSGVIQTRHTYKYDSGGHLIAFLSEGSNSTTKGTYRYVFDSAGNWTQRLATREISKDGNTKVENEVTYRTFEYY